MWTHVAYLPALSSADDLNVLIKCYMEPLVALAKSQAKAGGSKKSSLKKEKDKKQPLAREYDSETSMTSREPSTVGLSFHACCDLEQSFHRCSLVPCLL